MRSDNLLNRSTFIGISGEDDHLLGKVLKQKKKTADEEEESPKHLLAVL